MLAGGRSKYGQDRDVAEVIGARVSVSLPTSLLRDTNTLTHSTFCRFQAPTNVEANAIPVPDDLGAIVRWMTTELSRDHERDLVPLLTLG